MKAPSALRPTACLRPLALAALCFVVAAHGQTPRSSPAHGQRLAPDKGLSSEATASTSRTFNVLAATPLAVLLGGDRRLTPLFPEGPRGAPGSRLADVGRIQVRRGALGALGGAFAGSEFVQIGAKPAEEIELKAALLYHLSQFVDWPPSSFASPLDPLIIGVLGSDPFGDYLDDLARLQADGPRRIVVVRFRDARAARQAHVLFVSPSEHEHLQAIFAALEGRPVLTVSDVDNFLRRGGIVRFYRNAENKIRVRINLEAARATGLTISAKLLRVVEIVPPEEE